MDCDCRMFHAIGVDCNCIPPYVVLVAFMGWLSTRDEVTIISSRHSLGPIVDLIMEFCQSQGWPPPEDMGNWFDKHFKDIKTYPKG